MLLSRFWYLVLALLAGTGFGAALLTYGMFNRQYDADLEDSLRRDRREMEATLKIEARSQIDALAAFAISDDIRGILREASERQNDSGLPDMNRRLKEKLRVVNTDLKGYEGDLVFAVDREGVIIAQLGPNEARFGGGIGTFPLVERALSGYVRDDSWVYDGQAYRMAARPVIEQGRYVGAIVHGKLFDAVLCERISRRLGGATIGFFKAGALTSSYSPTDVARAPSAADLGAPLANVLRDVKMQRGEVTDALDLQGRGRAVYSLVTGSAASLDVGYGIARPRQALATPLDLFKQASSEDIRAVPIPIVGGGAFAVFIFAMMLVWLERDRPLGKMKKTTAALAKRQIERLDLAQFGGKYRKIAENVNEAMDKAIEQAAALAPKKKAADLDAILGPTPGGEQPAPFFGFAGPGGGAPEDIPSVPPAPPPAAPPPPAAAAPAPAAPPPPAPPRAGPGVPPPLAAPAPPPPAAAAPAPPPARPGPPGLPPRPAAGAGAAPAPGPASPGGPGGPRVPPPSAFGGAAPAQAAPLGTPGASGPGAGTAPGRLPKGTLLGMSGGLGSASAPAAGGGIPKGTLLGMPAEPTAGGGPVQAPSGGGGGPGGFGGENEDGATMVTRVPEELLVAAASGDMTNADAQAEENHFREVFDQFVALKRQCNESIAGLTYDKFVQTLRRNKEQIVAKHAAKRVRFTVYVKDGKAALKATPVKE